MIRQIITFIQAIRAHIMFKLESTVIGNYSLEKSIGEGTFGKVHLGIHLITGEKVISTKTKGCDKNP